MSRFDDLAKSRARGDSFLQSWRRSRAAAPSGEGVSRRDLIKKAGLVTGAAVVGSTMIQSVTAPAFAASPSCTNPVDAQRGCGSTCGTSTCSTASLCVIDQDCASGVCNAGTCKVAYSQSCEGATVEARDSNCASGYCNYADKCEDENTMKQMGASCHGQPPADTAKQCDASRLLVCSSPTNGVCVGLTGASCTADDQCVSGLCPSTAAPFRVCA